MAKAQYVQEIESEVRRIRRLVKKHRKLDWNEHQTRYSLVDPMLRVLGWNLADPRQVQIDSHTSGDKPDYLLFRSDSERPYAVVEAKRITIGDIDFFANNPVIVEPDDWTEWSEKARKQLTRYWKKVKPQLAVLTNGAFWDIYLLRDARGNLPNKRIKYFSILSQDPNEYVDTLKRLYRHKLR